MEKEAFFKLSYGLYIITTKYEEHFAGCVVNTVVQATAEEKPKLLVTVNKEKMCIRDRFGSSNKA